MHLIFTYDNVGFYRHTAIKLKGITRDIGFTVAVLFVWFMPIKISRTELYIGTEDMCRY